MPRVTTASNSGHEAKVQTPRQTVVVAEQGSKGRSWLKGQGEGMLQGQQQSSSRRGKKKTLNKTNTNKKTRLYISKSWVKRFLEHSLTEGKIGLIV